MKISHLKKILISTVVLMIAVACSESTLEKPHSSPLPRQNKDANPRNMEPEAKQESAEITGDKDEPVETTAAPTLTAYTPPAQLVPDLFGGGEVTLPNAGNLVGISTISPSPLPLVVESEALETASYQLSEAQLLQHIENYTSPLKSALIDYLEGKRRYPTAVLNVLFSINRDFVGHLIELKLLFKYYANKDSLPIEISTRMRELNKLVAEQAVHQWANDRGFYRYAYDLFSIGFSNKPGEVFAQRSQAHFVFEDLVTNIKSIYDRGYQSNIAEPEVRWVNGSSYRRQPLEVSESPMYQNDDLLIEYGIQLQSPGVIDLPSADVQRFLNPIYSFLDYSYNEPTLPMLNNSDKVETMNRWSRPFYINSRTTYYLDLDRNRIIFRTLRFIEKYDRDNNTLPDSPLMREDYYEWELFKDNHLQPGMANKIWDFFNKAPSRPRVYAFNIRAESINFWLPQEILLHMLEGKTKSVSGTYDYKAATMQINESSLNLFDANLDHFFVDTESLGATE